MASLRDQIVATLEVRRHNGECEYGSWYDVDHEDVPAWVADVAADDAVESDADMGLVIQGGDCWVWRRLTPEIVGGRIGRAMAHDVLAEDMPREWSGLDAQDGDQIPDGMDLDAVERVAKKVYQDAIAAHGM